MSHSPVWSFRKLEPWLLRVLCWQHEYMTPIQWSCRTAELWLLSFAFLEMAESSKLQTLIFCVYLIESRTHCGRSALLQNGCCSDARLVVSWMPNCPFGQITILHTDICHNLSADFEMCTCRLSKPEISGPTKAQIVKWQDRGISLRLPQTCRRV